MIFNTKVQGIPCQCQVTYTAGLPAVRYGTGAGDIHPPELPELEIQVLDRSGKPAPWLSQKLTPDDVSRLQEEFFLERDAEAYSYAH